MPSCACSACRTCSARLLCSPRWRCCPRSCFSELMAPFPVTPPGAQLITLMAALMLVVQLLMIGQRMLLTNIRLFALQSLLLAAIATVVAYAHHAGHVYVVAVLTFV